MGPRQFGPNEIDGLLVHSKGDSMDYIAQFRVMNPHQ